MKNSSTILCTLLLFSSISSYGADDDPESETPLLEEEHSAEVAILEPSFIGQPLVSPGEIDLSSPILTPSHKSSFLAVGLSSFIPGLGHAYLGDFQTAASLFGSSSLIYGLNSLELNETFRVSNLITMQNTWFYGIYAAYRDTRAYNKEKVYSYKMPMDSFTDLALAPFQHRVLKKPEVWGGILGALVLGVGVSYFALPKEKEFHVNLSTNTRFPLLAFPVSIGEESFFRGYLQSQISETLTPWAGILLSSLAFAAVHIPNAKFLEPEDRVRYYSVSLPFIMSFGAYFGWLTYKNRSLKESVAVHAWYDFILFLASYSATQSAAIGKPRFSLSIPF